MQQVLELLRERGLSLAVAEGDTGGLLLAWLTGVPGSSAVVRGGVVAYHDDLKRELLGVPADVIRQRGAVSAETVAAMAQGARRVAGAAIGLATTGIAGPGGGSPTKPVGLTFVAVADAERTLVREYHWQGARESNRESSARAALQLVLELLKDERMC